MDNAIQSISNIIIGDGGRYFASYAPLGSSECIPVLEAYMNLRSPYQDERYNVHYE